MAKPIKPEQWTLSSGFAVRSKDPELVERAVAQARGSNRPRGRARTYYRGRERAVEWMLERVYRARIRAEAPAGTSGPRRASRRAPSHRLIHDHREIE